MDVVVEFKEAIIIILGFGMERERAELKADEILKLIEPKIKEAYTDGFSDSRFDFDIENYID